MTNTERLKGAIVSAGLKQASVAEKMGISATALNNKITNKSPFTADEIKSLQVILNLSRNEVDIIFFADKVD